MNRVVPPEGRGESVQPGRVWRRTIAALAALAFAGLALFVFPGLYWIAADAAFQTFKKEQIVEHQMRWSRNEPGRDSPGPDYVIFHFVDYPDHHWGIDSRDVLVYLESRGAADVPVEYVVTTFLGRVKGFRVVGIGDLRQWRQGFSHAGHHGRPSPSPWDDFSRSPRQAP